jgi:hypothetical protein
MSFFGMSFSSMSFFGMSFFGNFFADYHFLDQPSQSKKVVNMIWHKVGSLPKSFQYDINSALKFFLTAKFFSNNKLCPKATKQ